MIDSMTFWDRAAPKYIRGRISDMKNYEAGLDHTRSYLSPDQRALELGCGSGMTALKLAPSVAHITGSDISGAMIAHARADGAGTPNADFVHAGAGDPRLAGRNWDVVLAFNVLHLLPDTDAAFRDIRALLPPGGLFISKTPCLGGLKWSFLRPVIGTMRLIGKAPEVVWFTPATLQDAIAGAGFEIVEVASYRSPLVVARAV